MKNRMKEKHVFQLKHSVSKSQKRGKNAKLSFSISLKIRFLSFLLGLGKRKKGKRKIQSVCKDKNCFQKRVSFIQ